MARIDLHQYSLLQTADALDRPDIPADHHARSIKLHTSALAAERDAWKQHAERVERYLLAQDTTDTLGYAYMLKHWRIEAGIS